jgi:hypothetical protein
VIDNSAQFDCLGQGRQMDFAASHEFDLHVQHGDAQLGALSFERVLHSRWYWPQV